MAVKDMSPNPTAFVSYSWDSEQHKSWVRELATRLRADGVDVKLDQWENVPGDQLPEYMETSLRANDFVLIVCTPNYKERSDNRKGGVGYEGDIMTAQVLTGQNDRKFIPILRAGDWTEAAPTWIAGKFYIDLTGDPYDEENYHILLGTLHGRRPQPPQLGSVPPAYLVQNEDQTPPKPRSLSEALQARKDFEVEVLRFDASQEYGVEFPYSDYLRLRITNNSNYILPYLTIQTTRFNSRAKRVGSSRAPSIKTANVLPGESLETDYYPRGHLPGVSDISVEIEHVIDDESMQFFKELEPFI
jgi:hypothetical protein